MLSKFIFINILLHLTLINRSYTLGQKLATKRLKLDSNVYRKTIFNINSERTNTEIPKTNFQIQEIGPKIHFNSLEYNGTTTDESYTHRNQITNSTHHPITTGGVTNYSTNLTTASTKASTPRTTFILADKTTEILTSSSLLDTSTDPSSKTISGEPILTIIPTQQLKPTFEPTPESTQLPIEEMDFHLNNLKTSLDKSDMNPINVLKMSENFKEILKNGLMKSNSLMTSMIIMDKMQKYSQSFNANDMKNFSDNIVESCSTVLDRQQVWQQLQDSNSKIEMSSKILQYIQNSGFNIGCHRNTTNYTKILKSNIVIETFSINNQMTNHILINNTQSGVILPQGIPEADPQNGCSPGTAVGAIINKLSSYLSDKLGKSQQIISNIVTFSLRNSLNGTQLPNNISPVKIMLKHNNPLMFGDRVQCVYWDFNQMNWSSKGCKFQIINSNRKLSICECNHLTNFAALMDVSGRETDTKLKDILTKVCCGLSIVCLILTIAFLSLFRALRNQRNKITSNLCICLLIVNLLVVFGMDSTQNNILCQTVAAFLLYFILCSFSWMLMEGYHLYQMIILVFSNIGHLRTLYLYGIGYVVPFFITLSAILGIGFQNLKETDSYFCWISSPSHPYRVWAVTAPALIAILTNMVILYLALREALIAKKRKKQIYQVHIHDNTLNSITQKLSQSFLWIKSFISFVVVFGITWISFVLYIHEFGKFFSYIFIVFNGLQGVLIFTFQILLNNSNRRLLINTYFKNILWPKLSLSTKITSISSKD